MKSKHAFNTWIGKMAWRDSRSSRKRLFLFMSSIILGIAALVAITSFGRNLEEAIHAQAKTLLGADLVIHSRQPWTPEAEAFVQSLGGEQSRETNFASMVSLPKNGSTRLADVRALEGRFPYYGKFQTAPASAADTFKEGPLALVEEGLMLQFGAEVGDQIQIGEFTYRIAGRLQKIPGEASVEFTGPRIYIPMAYLSQTKLLQRGSLASYKAYFKFDPTVDVDVLVAKIDSDLTKHRLRSDTVRERQAEMGQAIENVYRFLNLVGFIALLLGAIGVASAVHAYVKQKIGTVAILRCVGARAKQTMAVYLVQAMVMGLGGAMVGVLLGIGTQFLLPRVIGDLLPVSVEPSVSWLAILEGLATGLGITLLFALLPLLSVRKISPLLTLRSSYEETKPRTRDPLRWLTFLLIAAGVSGFALAQTERWTIGAGFVVGLAVAFGVLAGVAKLIMWLVRAFFPSRWAYVWRQGLANLYRPNNQTVVLMLSLGLGTFLISTLYLTQSALLAHVSLTGGGTNPNMVLFDIQSDQNEGVASLIRSFDLPLMQRVPIVTMRLEAVRGRSVEDIMNDPRPAIRGWALQREYRVTYRDHLIETEKVIAGAWQGRVDPSSGTIPISLEESMARSLRVSVGDQLVFNVQGVPMTTTVSSIRQVEWRRVQPNFLLVFPAGALEEAPQFHVLVTRVESSEMSARVQRAVVKQFPNVSIIDLTLILNTIDSVLSKVSLIIKFMASFSVLTGLIVLASAVITSRYHRIQESVLLRTLGASRAQIIKIMVIEYLFLGGFAAATGLLLSLGGGWALAYFVFEVTFVPAVLPLLLTLIVVIGLTVLIGMVNSRGIWNRPPLEVLRVEV
jgi:putative ABC transport system permease protein